MERDEPPAGWEWEDEWTIDANRAVDEEGFEYCVNQTLGGWCPTEKVFHLNRRRRWYRTRVVQVGNAIELEKKVRCSFNLIKRKYSTKLGEFTFT